MTPALPPEDRPARAPAPLLDAAERRSLRARAHHLVPVVMIGDAGVSPAVIDEADRALTAHELIKVHVAGADRADRQQVLDALCRALDCAPVQSIGRMLVLWRPDPHKAAERDAPPKAPRPPKRHVTKHQAAARLERKKPAARKRHS